MCGTERIAFNVSFREGPVYIMSALGRAHQGKIEPNNFERGKQVPMGTYHFKV